VWLFRFALREAVTFEEGARRDEAEKAAAKAKRQADRKAARRRNRAKRNADKRAKRRKVATASTPVGDVMDRLCLTPRQHYWPLPAGLLSASLMISYFTQVIA